MSAQQEPRVGLGLLHHQVRRAPGAGVTPERGGASLALRVGDQGRGETGCMFLKDSGTL